MSVDIKPVMNDLLQVRVACKANGQVGLNITHWVVTNVVTLGATVSELAQALDQTWANAYINWLSTHADYIGTGVKILTPPQTLEGAYTGNAQPGVHATSLLPTQVSGLIRLQTDRGGPANRGRLYVPFVPAAAVTASGELSVFGVGLIDAIAAAYDTQQTVVGATGTTMIRLVIKHGPGPTNPPPSLLSVLVKNLAASSSLATQRRRGDFGKLNTSPFQI